MITTNTLIELESIVDDINLIITTVVRHLDSLFQDKKAENQSQQVKDELHQLNGIFTLLNLDGAQLLVAEADEAFQQLTSSTDQLNRTHIYRALSDALAILSRYIEYVCQKSVSSPQLLLPTINQLREVNQLPALKESVFFALPEDIEEIIRSDESADFGMSVLDLELQKVRYLRQMFQVGLIEVIRNSNVKGGFKMMRKSLMRVEEDYKSYSLPDMWLIAQCMIEGYISGGLAVEPQRIKVLSLVDRQYRLLEFADLKKSQADENYQVIREMLYLVSLSNSENVETQAIAQKYHLHSNRVDDVNFESNAVSLSQPTAKDLKSLSNGILEELFQVEGILNASSAHSKDTNTNLLSIVENLASLLLTVQLREESHKLSLVTAILRKAVSENQALSKSDLNISKGVVQELREFFNENGLSSLSSSSKSNRNKLNEEQQAACHVTRQHIANAVKQFDMYAKDSVNPQPLDIVAKELFNSIAGMKALELSKLMVVTQSCIELVNFMKVGKHATENLPLLFQFMADAIASLEFYLETIEQNRAPSPRVIEFANESIKELKQILVIKRE